MKIKPNKYFVKIHQVYYTYQKAPNDIDIRTSFILKKKNPNKSCLPNKLKAIRRLKIVPTSANISILEITIEFHFSAMSKTRQNVFTYRCYMGLCLRLQIYLYCTEIRKIENPYLLYIPLFD